MLHSFIEEQQLCTIERKRKKKEKEKKKESYYMAPLFQKTFI